MAQFHFVEDYEQHVANLLATHPIDEAMALAVGGNYEEIGFIEAQILRHSGLRSGMSVLDLGCGSGRLAYALSRTEIAISYVGIDIIQSLLDYAATKAPGHYRFLLNRELSIPVESASIDIACAFSVFTHLLHEETYLYMQDIRRALRPDGRLVFSFLEFAEPSHWSVFANMVENKRVTAAAPLNTFIERSTIEVWARQLGYAVQQFISGSEAVPDGRALGQATVVLTAT